MPFAKGESGNPCGRPPGARNKKTLLREVVFDGEGDELTAQVIARAHAGDAAAMRFCLDRLLPRGADRPVAFALPRIESGADARRATGEITEAIASAELTPREAVDLLRVVEKSAHAIAAAERAEQAAQRGKPDDARESMVQQQPERPRGAGSRSPAEAADSSAGESAAATLLVRREPPRGPADPKNNGNNKNTIDPRRPTGAGLPEPLAAAAAPPRPIGPALAAASPGGHQGRRARLLASTAGIGVAGPAYAQRVGTCGG